MAATYEFVVELPHVGRNLSDTGWEEIDATHISYWKAANDLLGKREFDYKGHLSALEVDWRPVIRRYQRHYRVMQELYSAIGTPAVSQIIEKFPQSKIKLSAKILVNSEKAETVRNSYLQSVLESFLYDVFLIMNIAAPGSCGFSVATLRQKDQQPSTRIRRVFQRELSLSSFYFEAAHLDSWEGNWPPVKFVEVEKVAGWFFAVRSGVSQVPKNRMEKILIALLHIAKLDVSPMVIIWLFYALETLFDTKAGENFRVLIERIQILLSPSDREIKMLRKNLRKLYDLRSGIVHGGLEVIHPMRDELLDPSVDEEYIRLMDATNFGFTLLLSSIQSVIESNWKWPHFDEVMSGEPMKTPPLGDK